MQKYSVISGLPARMDQLTVQKSNPLLGLWQSSWTLPEFKILDVYLSRIDSHQPERRCVCLEKGELEAILGVTRINLKDLQNRLDNLIFPVHVDDPDVPKGYRTIALFEAIKYDRDESGLWNIELKCSGDAMKYIFNIDNIGYLRYKLHSVINLKSRYSYLLFLYLEQNRFRKEWTVDLEELRKVMDCLAPYYDDYRRFNTKILKACKAEIMENTGCRFEYEPIRRGRRTKSIHFVVEDIVAIEEPNDQEIPDYPADEQMPDQEFSEEASDFHFKQSPEEFVMSALIPRNCQTSEFSAEEMHQIWTLLPTIPMSHMSEIDMVGPARDDIQLRWYHYLLNRYAEFKRIASVKKINNRFAYFLKMLESDID